MENHPCPNPCNAKTLREAKKKCGKCKPIPEVKVELPTPEIMWNNAREMNFLCFSKWYAKIKF